MRVFERLEWFVLKRFASRKDKGKVSLMNDTTNAAAKKPVTSDLIVEFLNAKGRKTRKAGIATTQEIADHIGKSVKYTYDRLWWLAKKDSRLIMMGSGKTAQWRSVPKARKAKAEEPTAAPAADPS